MIDLLSEALKSQLNHGNEESNKVGECKHEYEHEQQNLLIQLNLGSGNHVVPLCHIFFYSLIVLQVHDHRCPSHQIQYFKIGEVHKADVEEDFKEQDFVQEENNQWISDKVDYQRE